MKEKIAVLYHKKCFDGFGGAWSAWKKFGGKARYFAAEYGFPSPKELKNKKVYLIDFCYPAGEMKKLKKNNVLTVIDHHITAREAAKISNENYYDINHSGSVIAWKHFHPQKPVPRLLRHIEDMDLWRFKMPFTMELMSELDSRKMDFSVWNKAVSDLEIPTKRKKYVERGKIIMAYKNLLIKNIVEGANMVLFEGRKIPALNFNVNSLVSELGAELYKKYPPVALVWAQKNGRIVVSLRSNGEVDVSKIAKKYGGGGHKSSAGFSFKLKKQVFPWKMTK